MERTGKELIEYLKEMAVWVRRETLKVHRVAPETRLASSLSDIEIFVALYYGGILKQNPKDISWEGRDRFIVSKGHGGVSMYPILADLGFFDKRELSMCCQEGSILGCIPDTVIPGFETINGSLGHGLGVACGMATALREKKSGSRVFVLAGDGELYEGAVWEAVMLAPQLKLGNLVLIVDRNKVSMLDFCSEIIDLDPLDEKFRGFRWMVRHVDGHDMREVYEGLLEFKKDDSPVPKVIIAETIKGKGVPRLETDCLSHIKSLKEAEVDALLDGLKCSIK
ncbi:MAG: transketolase [Deltaproteobacteria bacterium]|nr:transketolase [Deltaproteobacteria bacterium]